MPLLSTTNFSDKIQILPLPTRSDANINFEGKIVVSSGWGRYSDGKYIDEDPHIQKLNYSDYIYR